MKNEQKYKIIGACAYSIGSLQNIKHELCKIDAKNPELTWAIGGIVSSLVSYLIASCGEVFEESISQGGVSGKEDLLKIKQDFDNFIDRMIGNE